MSCIDDHASRCISISKSKTTQLWCLLHKRLTEYQGADLAWKSFVLPAGFSQYLVNLQVDNFFQCLAGFKLWCKEYLQEKRAESKEFDRVRDQVDYDGENMHFEVPVFL